MTRTVSLHLVERAVLGHERDVDGNVDPLPAAIDLGYWACTSGGKNSFPKSATAPLGSAVMASGVESPPSQ